MSAKSSKRRRNKRKAHVLSKTHAQNVVKLMGVKPKRPAPTPPKDKQ